MKFFFVRSALVLILLMSVLGSTGSIGRAQAIAEAGIFEDFNVPPDARFEVPVEVRGVEGLYAIDIEIRYDPAILSVEDANPDLPGVQPALGTFLEAGLTLFNEADNALGVIRFAMSQVNPSEPKSGDGIILVLTLLARQAGESDLEVSFLEASTREGEAIPLEAVDAVVQVSAEAEVPVATPIPIQEPTGIIQVPTLAATVPPVPTPTLEPTATTLPESIAENQPTVDVPTATQEGELDVEAEVEEGPIDPGAEAVVEGERRATILDYWWAVLIVVLVAGGTAAYLVLSKKQSG